MQKIFYLIQKKRTGGESRLMSQEVRIDSVESRAEIQIPRVQSGNILDKGVRSQESDSHYSTVNCQMSRWKSQEQRVESRDYRVG